MHCMESDFDDPDESVHDCGGVFSVSVYKDYSDGGYSKHYLFHLVLPVSHLYMACHRRIHSFCAACDIALFCDACHMVPFL